jgi:hypothetical protein
MLRRYLSECAYERLKFTTGVDTRKRTERSTAPIAVARTEGGEAAATLKTTMLFATLIAPSHVA